LNKIKFILDILDMAQIRANFEKELKQKLEQKSKNS